MLRSRPKPFPSASKIAFARKYPAFFDVEESPICASFLASWASFRPSICPFAQAIGSAMPLALRSSR